MKLGVKLILETTTTAEGVVEETFLYAQPNGVDLYLAPDGVSMYEPPEEV